MSSPAPKCRTCAVDMQVGWVAETVTAGRKYNFMFREPTCWVEGEPEPVKDDWGEWTGEFVTKGRGVLPIKACRCPQCELLDLYAPSEWLKPYKRP